MSIDERKTALEQAEKCLEILTNSGCLDRKKEKKKRLQRDIARVKMHINEDDDLFQTKKANRSLLCRLMIAGLEKKNLREKVEEQ